MTRASKLLNKYEVEMLVTSDRDIDYNNFYKDELIAFCKCLRECNKKQQEIIDKTRKFLKDKGRKLYDKHDTYGGKWYTPDELDILNKILKDEEV